MICKKDVISWFKDLESYKRIDMMCTLLNMCLPFELRFLGTCLEELGRRDSQELRGIELRVNNPQDLSSDMLACQKGEPSDKKIRRKMALYLALIRACNRSCVTEIFRTLDEWGKRNFYKMNDLDTLQELLLVYTMAANHPVFSFEQHMKCSEIFEKIRAHIFIKDGKLTSENQVSQSQAEKNFKTLVNSQDTKNLIIPTQQDIMSQQRTLRTISHPGQQILHTTPLAVLSHGSTSYPCTHRSKVLTSDGSHQYPLTLESIPQFMTSSAATPCDATPHLGSWSVRPNLNPFASFSISINEQPAQSSSPILSQKSSPSTSRATSPNSSSGNTLVLQSQKEFNEPHVRNLTQRDYKSEQKIRRSSLEPTVQTNLQSNQHTANEMYSQNTEDVYINTDGTISQLQMLIRNGFGKNATQNRSTTGKFITQQQTSLNQQYQVASHENLQTNSPSALSMNNLSLTDKIAELKLNESNSSSNVQTNVESDSGSSNGSYCDTSPRLTPDLSQSSSQATDFIHVSLESYKTQINTKCVNEISEEIPLPSFLQSLTPSTAIKNDSSSNVKSSNSCSQQQSFGNDLGTSTSLRQALTQVNASGMNTNDTNTGIKTVSTSISANKKVLNTILMSSPSDVASRGIFGNVTSSSLLNQQQYNTSYPYHVVTPQSVNSAIRSPIIPNNSTIVPSPHIRIPTFQIPSNGEIVYPGFHSAGIAYLSNGPVGMSFRSSSSLNTNQQNTNQNAPHSAPLQQQKKQQIMKTCNVVQLAASPYSSLTLGAIKPISCYNCGSQSHCGRDCHEESMDDVTRNAVYKLDYTVSSCDILPATDNQSKSSPQSINSENGSQNMQPKHNIISLNEMDIKVLSTPTS